MEKVIYRHIVSSKNRVRQVCVTEGNFRMIAILHNNDVLWDPINNAYNISDDEEECSAYDYPEYESEEDPRYGDFLFNVKHSKEIKNLFQSFKGYPIVFNSRYHISKKLKFKETDPVVLIGNKNCPWEVENGIYIKSKSDLEKIEKEINTQLLFAIVKDKCKIEKFLNPYRDAIEALEEILEEDPEFFKE